MMRRKAAFTLVELLVVIGIIALLIAILMPVLGRAREASNRVKCAANLHNLGIAVTQFANDHKSYFPMAYQMPDPAFPYRFPNVQSADDTLYAANTNKWKTHGIPVSVWEKYGMNQESWRCPSAFYDDVKLLTAADGVPPEWGAGILWTHYMYIAGITNANRGKSSQNWGLSIPAVSLHERDGSQRIVAADMVYYAGAGTKWDKTNPRYMINHQRKDMPNAAAQNVLYGDGHVATLGLEKYPTALNTSNNWSLLHAGSGVGGYFYWGPTETQLVLNPPPPPNPNPTPTPPNPNPPPAPILPTPLP